MAFNGWIPPTGAAYGPWSAPGYGTYNDPETAGFNLFGDARAWLGANPQIFNPYSGEMVASTQEPLQVQARNNLTQFLNNYPHSYTDQAAQTANWMSAGYSPMSVQAQSAMPSTVGSEGTVYAREVGAPTAQYGGDVSAERVGGGSFTSGDWGAYMNPYTQNVVDLSMQDIERSRQIANASGARSADASTYGGSRNALIEAETNRGYADVAARTSAQLRSQGFDTAAGLMGQDLSRGLQSGLANQGTGLQAALANQATRTGLGQFNAGLGLQSGVANQGAWLNADLANQDLRRFNASTLTNSGQFNANLGQQASLANQQADISGAGIRLGATDLLGRVGQDFFNQNLTGASALNQFGTQDQQARQSALDAQYQEYLRSAYGPMEGYNFLGGLLSGNSYQTPGGPSRFSSALGGAATGAGIGNMLFPGVGGLVGAGLGGLGGLFF